MPYDPNHTIEMTPVDPGDLSDIPPDLPAGAWVGAITVKPTATGDGSKDPKTPMLIIEASADECLTPGNENFIGGKTAAFIVIYPANHKNSRLAKTNLKKMTDAYELGSPDASSLSEDPPNFSSMAEWIDAVETEARPFWTTTQEDRKTGEKRTILHFSEPGVKLERADLEEEESAPAKKAPTKKSAAPSKKVNGAARGASARR
jgi:hypothetical protein